MNMFYHMSQWFSRKVSVFFKLRVTLGKKRLQFVKKHEVDKMDCGALVKGHVGLISPDVQLKHETTEDRMVIVVLSLCNNLANNSFSFHGSDYVILYSAF